MEIQGADYTTYNGDRREKGFILESRGHADVSTSTHECEVSENALKKHMNAALKIYRVELPWQ